MNPQSNGLSLGNGPLADCPAAGLEVCRSVDASLRQRVPWHGEAKESGAVLVWSAPWPWPHPVCHPIDF